MRLHRPRVVMQENCDYDSEIENVLLDYEMVGTNGNIVTHTRDCFIVDDTLIGSRHDNRGSKPTHSDLLRKVGGRCCRCRNVSFRRLRNLLCVASKLNNTDIHYVLYRLISIARLFTQF